MIAACLNESLPTHIQRDDASSAGLDWIRFAPAMICAFDSTGSIRHVSERWLTCLGYDRDAVIGVNTVAFMAPSFQSLATVITLPMLFRSGRCDSIEWTLRSRNGGTLEVLVSAEVVDSAANEPLAVAAFMDISNQKGAWQSLIASEARFRLLCEQSMDMMFQLDENLVWRYASPACFEIAGYDPETLIGKAAFQKLHPDDAEQVRRTFADVAAGRQQHGSLIYRVWHADGRWIWAGTRFRSTRHELTGEPSGLVGSLRDVTAKMEAEKTLPKPTVNWKFWRCTTV